MEDQVVSLGLSKRLKKLGYKQKGCIWWGDDLRDKDKYRLSIGKGIKESTDFKNICVAQTVVEMVEKMPDIFEKDSEKYLLRIQKAHGEYYVSYGFDSKYGGYFHFEDDGSKDRNWMKDKSLPDAMAKMLIYLYENKYI